MPPVPGIPRRASRTRHRGRRAPGDPTTTGSIPLVRTEPDLPDPTVDYRRPERSKNPYLEIRYAEPALPELSVRGFTAPPARPAPEPHPAPETSSAQVRPAPATRPAPLAHPAEPLHRAPDPEPLHRAPDPEPRPAAHAAPPSSFEAHARAASPTTDELPAIPAERATSAEIGATPLDALDTEWMPATNAVSPADVTPTAEQDALVAGPATTVTTGPHTGFDILDDAPRRGAHAAGGPGGDGPGGGPGDQGVLLDGPGGDGPGDEGTAQGMPASRNNRKVLIAGLAVVLVLVLAGGFALHALGVFDSRKDFASDTGGQPTLVAIPEHSSLRDMGQILADAGVVGSQHAFVNAAGSQALSGGYYRLPTGISGAAAVEKMANGDKEYRVGRLVIPEGAQLDSKKGVDGKITPGIFAEIEAATTVEADGTSYGVTAEELQQAAATATVGELGVPDWAKAPVEKLAGDHRRLEGLIASGAWEDLDPRLNAQELLHSLITRSVARFETWGLLSANNSGLMPYDTLIVASIVEAEVSQPDDYAKVARVILNRLEREQRLQMDSTVNYTAEITDIDVRGKAFSDKNEWNTYQRDGLPATPIGAVGERALESVENPAQGDWLYFVTVDKQGTTLFARTFERHKRNREVACRNKLVVTGCS